MLRQSETAKSCPRFVVIAASRIIVPSWLLTVASSFLRRCDFAILRPFDRAGLRPGWRSSTVVHNFAVDIFVGLGHGQASRKVVTTMGPVTKVIAILNQKGGVGKTTLAVHLATALARAKRTVLLVDADPQGSALDWAAARHGDPLFPVVGLPKSSIHKELPTLGSV